MIRLKGVASKHDLSKYGHFCGKGKVSGIESIIPQQDTFLLAHLKKEKIGPALGGKLFLFLFSLRFR